MKVKVNDNEYDIEIVGEKVLVNNINFDLKRYRDKITLGNDTFYLDFVEETEPSLMIINGVSYVVSKDFSNYGLEKEIRAPINGKIADLLVNVNDRIEKDQTILVLEAMKMENQIKSHLKGVIEKIYVSKDQLVKKGDILVKFE